MSIDAGRINGNGWRQGSVFSVADSKELLESEGSEPHPEGTRLIIASHSCDVVAVSPLETTVDVFPAVPVPESTGLQHYGGGRDARRLRLHVQVEGQAGIYELVAPHRLSIGRELLETYLPDADANLNEDGLFHLEQWLASRYKRRALPDTFADRLGSEAQKKLRKAIGGVAEHVEHLLFSLSPDSELADVGSSYKLRLVLLCKGDSLADRPTRDLLEGVAERIRDIFAARRGIVVSVFLHSDKKFSWAEFKTFGTWGFEDLSRTLA